MARKLLIIQAAALSRPLEGFPLPLRPIETVFPAVTCTVQASFRTASLPSRHGMIANGIFHRDLRRAMFWEQSARLVAGERIWSGFRRRGGKVAMLFWQQSLGEDVDVVLSPAPIHRHHGGMIPDCYSQPPGLYEKLCRAVGRCFRLQHYWGPLASARAGDWIAEATLALLRDRSLAPEVCLTYLPSADYDLQRHDPLASRAALDALARLGAQLRQLIDSARELSYEVVVFGDYAVTPVQRAVYPNRALAEAGLLATRTVKDMLYPDLYTSRAFAMVDHQVAHVYAPAAAELERTRAVLSQLPGVDTVMDRREQAAAGVDHPNAGELVIVAQTGTWFAYPWWTGAAGAPEFARHVDIHNKPGYDPCELFFGWPPMTVSLDSGRVHGSHGRAGKDGPVVAAWTPALGEPKDIVELAQAVARWLNE